MDYIEAKKHFKYIPAPSRYLRETFERIRYMDNLNLGLKRQKWQICSIRGPFEAPRGPFLSHSGQKHLKYIPAPSSYLS